MTDYSCYLLQYSSHIFVLSVTIFKEMCEIPTWFIRTLTSKFAYLLDKFVSPLGSRALARDFFEQSEILITGDFFHTRIREEKTWNVNQLIKVTLIFVDKGNTLFILCAKFLTYYLFCRLWSHKGSWKWWWHWIVKIIL